MTVIAMAPTEPARELENLTLSVRACFRELGAVANTLHQGLSVTAAMRAVMEHLADHGPQTVPDIAGAKRVSRQNIQVRVDRLSERELVELRPNPAHRRSALVALTEHGRRTFAAMQGSEHKLFAELASGLPKASIRTARKVLSQLTHDLQTWHSDLTSQTEGKEHD